MGDFLFFNDIIKGARKEITALRLNIILVRKIFTSSLEINSVVSAGHVSSPPPHKPERTEKRSRPAPRTRRRRPSRRQTALRLNLRFRRTSCSRTLGAHPTGTRNRCVRQHSSRRLTRTRGDAGRPRKRESGHVIQVNDFKKGSKVRWRNKRQEGRGVKMGGFFVGASNRGHQGPRKERAI